MLRRNRIWLPALTSLLVLALLLGFFTALLTPKQHDYGSTWGHYRQEEKNTVDVLFIGSSITYCDVVPAVFREETGLTAYVMGGMELPFPMEAYYLREALRTQRPGAVFFEVTAAFWKQGVSHTKTTVGQMPWGTERLKATLTQAEPENRPGLFFPLYFYHERWDSLTPDDWKTALRGYDRDPLAGYTFLNEYRVYDAVVLREKGAEPAEEDQALETARELAEICRKRGIVPVFYLSPCVERTDPARTGPFLDRVAALPGAVVLDCGEMLPDIGLDLHRNFYDALHLNAGGAETFTRWLARWSEENLSLTPGGGEDEALWQDRTARFHRLLETPPSPAEDFYLEPLRWAEGQGIAEAGGPDVFLPNSPCSCARWAVMLRRMAEGPVPDEDEGRAALAWAGETGLLDGTGITGPEEPLRRGQLITTLWRLAGSPEIAAEEDPFADLEPSAPCYQAALWAWERGIAGGDAGGTAVFRPEDECTRGEAVTFLWRYAGEEPPPAD